MKITANQQLIHSIIIGVLFATAVVIASMGAFRGLSGTDEAAQQALPSLRINIVLILVLIAYLALRLRRVFIAPEGEAQSPRLHRRFILFFSLSAMVPALIVGVIMSALLSQNISDIFGPQVRQTMETAQANSSAYLRGKMQDIGQGVLDISGHLNNEENLLPNRITYRADLINQAVFYQFPAVYVVDRNGYVLTRAESGDSPPYVFPDPESFEFADDNKVAFTTRADVDFISALYKLENYENAYLYTGRFVQQGVAKNLQDIEAIEREYTRYNNKFGQLSRVFLLTYTQIAALTLIATIWLGLWLGNKVVAPLGQMVNAAEKVRAGDLKTRVNVTGVWDEIGDLGNAMNRMISQLGAQRGELIREHDISERRREFSEAVLSGVSAGVIGLSPKGKITTINRYAEHLLGLDAKKILGRPLKSILKSFYPAFRTAIDDINNQAEDQVNLETKNGLRNLDIRISSYRGERPGTGWVVTIDDTTRLVAAQRHSAWRDVAQRIAHEIKNPLTPIQLSAERLERKYLKEIKSDPGTFKTLTKTIVRHVENLGRMVDEFSAFARMPAPILQPVRVDALIRDAQFAQGVAYPDIQLKLVNSTDEDLSILCDHRLITQALANIYKNASESIQRRVDTDGNGPPGQISTLVHSLGSIVMIDVIDNGTGWPLPDRDRLLEPYMTTREKGSGLGLAIVKRIAEDHDGDLFLEDRKDGKIGAAVQLCLPITKQHRAPKYLASSRLASSRHRPRRPHET